MTQELSTQNKIVDLRLLRTLENRRKMEVVIHLDLLSDLVGKRYDDRWLLEAASWEIYVPNLEITKDAKITPIDEYWIHTLEWVELPEDSIFYFEDHKGRTLRIDKDKLYKKMDIVDIEFLQFWDRHSVPTDKRTNIKNWFSRPEVPCSIGVSIEEDGEYV